MVGAALLGVVALAATSGFGLLGKTQRKIATTAEMRDLINEIRPILSNPAFCSKEIQYVLANALPNPVTPATLPAGGAEVVLKRVTLDSSGNPQLGSNFVGQGLRYGPLLITSAKIIKKAKLDVNQYLLGLSVTVDRGVGASGEATSLGYRYRTEIVPFSALVDSNGNVTDCSGNDTINTANAVPSVVCNILKPDPSLAIDAASTAGPFYVWDSSSQTCVFKYNMNSYYGTLDSSPTCPAGQPFLKCTAQTSGTYTPYCVQSDFPMTGQSIQACSTPSTSSYDSSTGTCSCDYATDYGMTGTERCGIVCGTLIH